VLKRKRNIPYLLILLFSFSLTAEVEEEIIVEAKKIDSISDWKADVSSTSLNSEEITLIDAQHPKQVFTRVPGVWVSRGSGQEHLTSIRSPVLTGPGACGSFLILEDGIPVRPNGFCNVNGLFETQTEIASSIEVIRGPASARYGSNAMHGVINVVSKPIEDINTISSNIGPNGYTNFKSSIGNSDDWRINSFFSTDDGFREESGYHQQKLQIKNRFNLYNSDAIFNLRLTNLNQETAGYISGKDVYKDRRQSKENLNPEAYRDAFSLKSSLKFSLGPKDKIVSFIPYFRKTKMEFLQHYLPGTPVEKNSHSSLGFIGLHSGISKNIEITSGIQVEIAKVELEELQEFALTTSSAFNNAVRPQGFHYFYEVDSRLIALFVGFNDFSLTENSFLFGDLRLEHNEYSYKNKMLSGNTRDDGTVCGFGGCYYSRPEDREDNFEEVSFRLGIERELDFLTLFSQVSMGFRPPQMTELYRLQKKQIVGDIDSEKLVMLEIGSRFSAEYFEGSLSLYSGKKRDSIFRDAENFIQDHGKTNHKGLELFVRLEINETNSLFLAGTFQNHKYDFSSETSMKEKINSGNYVDTSPRTSFNLRWVNLFSDYMKYEIEVERMGSYYTDAANLHKYEGHTLIHSRFVYFYRDKLTQFIRVHNLLDEDYAERADFNAFGGDRYFPGLPRQVYFGLEYTF
jgi:outer membrane receptor protein involved in Fe transport